MVLYAAIAVGVLLLLSLLVMYNRFVRQRTLVEESWGGIDVELTRRHNLIPNLVETVRGYATHEQAVLDTLVQAREAAAAHQADQPKQREGFEDAVGGALATVLARVEAYPDLKASTNFLHLQTELTTTEDRIAAARRFYNGNVRAYNTRVRTVPSNLVAAAFGFRTREFFEIRDQAARSVAARRLRSRGRSTGLAADGPGWLRVGGHPRKPPTEPAVSDRSSLGGPIPNGRSR